MTSLSRHHVLIWLLCCLRCGAYDYITRIKANRVVDIRGKPSCCLSVIVHERLTTVSQSPVPLRYAMKRTTFYSSCFQLLFGNGKSPVSTNSDLCFPRKNDNWMYSHVMYYRFLKTKVTFYLLCGKMTFCE